MHSFLLAAILGVAMSVGTVFPAQAVSLKPVRVFLTIDSGKEHAIPITIKNDEQNAVTVQPVVYGMRTDDRDLPVFSQGVDEGEKWIKKSIDTFSLAPGEQKDVVFTVVVPTRLPASTHYLGLGVQTVGSAASSATTVAARLLSLVTVQVAGQAGEKINILDWRSARPVFWGKTWNFLLQLKNTGNIDAPVMGETVVENMFHQQVSKNTLRSTVVLSQAQKQIRVTLPTSLRWPGRYKVMVRLSYGLTHQLVEKSVYVLYVPIWLGVTLSVLLLTMAVSGVYLKIKNRYE